MLLIDVKTVITRHFRNSPLNLTAVGGLGRQRKPTDNSQAASLTSGKFVSFQLQQHHGNINQEPQQHTTSSCQQQQQQMLNFNNQQAFDYRLPNKMTAFYGQQVGQQQPHQQQQQQQNQQQQQELANLGFGDFNCFNVGDHHLVAEMGKESDDAAQNVVHLDLSFGNSDANQQAAATAIFSAGCGDFLIGYNSALGFGEASAEAQTGEHLSSENYVHVAAQSRLGLTPGVTHKAPVLGSDYRFSCETCRLHFVEESQLLSHNKLVHDSRPATAKRSSGNKTKKYRLTTAAVVDNKKPMNMTRQPMNMTIGKRIYEESDDEEEESAEILGLTEPSSMLSGAIDRPPPDAQDDWLYQCAACADKFPTKESLQEHFRQHNDVKPFKCGQCGLGFVHRADRKRHESSQHRLDKRAVPNICNICHKTFTRRSDLSVHKRNVHTGKTAATCISCQSCAQIFTSEKDATRHVCSGKDGGRLRCDLCGSVLATRVEWGVHMWKHTKDAAFIIMSESDPLPNSSKLCLDRRQLMSCQKKQQPVK
jgi:hypothetical protein